MNKEKPNILFIMADDHAANAISCYGSRINKTPNIDRIASGGARLDNCFCTNSICTPSRASILTGQYSHVNQVYTLADPLNPNRQNVAKMLKKHGYQTAVIGKWHLHSWPSGFGYSSIIPDSHHGGHGTYVDPILEVRGEQKQHKGYITDVITDYSVDWLESRDRDKPFFLLCHHKAPHRSWIPDEEHASMYEDESIPEPENLFDDYSKRSRAAANAK
ncbi:MAG: sulfatase-like hydrolase/transferase, partial [Candidatus Thorarchaeota archaeon]